MYAKTAIDNIRHLFWKVRFMSSKLFRSMGWNGIRAITGILSWCEHDIQSGRVTLRTEGTL